MPYQGLSKLQTYTSLIWTQRHLDEMRKEPRNQAKRDQKESRYVQMTP